MDAPLQPTKELKKPSFLSGVWFPVIFSFGSTILRHGFGVYAPTAWIVWGAITICICYAIEPNPKIVFIKHFIAAELCLIILVVTNWFVPQMLRSTIPEFWAYALPIAAVSLATYFVLPLFGVGRRYNFWWWLIGSVVFAGLFGWLISSAPESKY